MHFICNKWRVNMHNSVEIEIQRTPSLKRGKKESEAFYLFNNHMRLGLDSRGNSLGL